MAKHVEIQLTITPEDLEPDHPQWVAICNNLRQELEDIENLSISLPTPEETPKDAKGEPVSIGAFILALAAAPAVVKLVGCLNTWLRNLGNRKVTITLTKGKQKITASATGFSEAAVRNIVASAGEQLDK